MSLTSDNHIKEIVKSIKALSSTRGAETVYRDWCECFALSLANGCNPLKESELWKKRETRYLDIVKRYSKEDVCKFSEMCAHLSMAFDSDPWNDYLGKIYMELFGGNKNLGQCFTPMCMCLACADTAIEPPKDGEVCTIADECCGGGAMLIAACQRYYESKVDYQRYLKITAGDVDSLCVHMCYIQLSLLGARAEVWQRNALSRETYDMFITPMEMLWPMKYANIWDKGGRK